MALSVPSLRHLHISEAAIHFSIAVAFPILERISYVVSTAADGHVVGQLDPLCGELGALVVDADCPVIQTAALWPAAHDARCLSYQWLSNLRCSWSHQSDCAQLVFATGTNFNRCVAVAADSLARCH